MSFLPEVLLTHRLAVALFVALVLCAVSAKAEEDVPAEMEVAFNQEEAADQETANDEEKTTETSASAEEERANELRFKLAQVNLYSETGKFDKAFGIIEQLKMDYPNNPRVLAAEAQLNYNIGNYNSAFIGLNKAILLDPNDEDILEQQRAAAFSQGPNILGGYTYRRTDLAYEQLARASGQFPLTPTLNMVLSVENNHMHTRTPVIRQNGSARHFRGDQQRGAIVLNKIFENNHELNAALYANTFTAGFGAEHSWWGTSGVTKLRGEFNRPYWGYVEMVVEGGTRSDLHLERRQIFSKNFIGTIGGGFNHYSLDDIWSAADALAWNAELEYSLPFSLDSDPHNEINVTAAYTGDAEYFTFVERRGPAGGRYKPLSASDYEVHAGTLSVGKKLFDDLLLQGYGGYSLNRLNDNSGPLYGAALNYSLSKKLNIEFRASHTDSGGENNSQSEDLLGLNLKWVL